jgi:CheY-like chemotaxis protein
MRWKRQRPSSVRYWLLALFAALLTVVGLGWVVARDFRQSEEAANQLDGLEATRRIRAHEDGHRARIIALSANVVTSDEARCRAAGMDGYLQKPLSLDALSDALDATTRPAARTGGM